MEQILNKIVAAQRALCYPSEGNKFAPRKKLSDLTQEDLDSQWELLNETLKLLKGSQ